MSTVTLEQVRDWHREQARAKDVVGEIRFPGPNESPFYRHPSQESKRHDAMADAIAAHLAQPAQAVDVGAIREVIKRMRWQAGNNNPKTHIEWAEAITRALPASPTTDKEKA